MTVQKTILTAGAVAFMLSAGITSPAWAGDDGQVQAGAIDQMVTIGGATKLYQGGVAATQALNVVRGRSINVQGTIRQSAQVNGDLTMHNYGMSVTQGVNVVQAGEPVNDAIDGLTVAGHISGLIKDLAGR